MSARRTHRSPSTSSTMSSTPPLPGSSEEDIYFEILHKLHIAIRTLNDPAAVRHTLAEVVRLVEDASVMTNMLSQQNNFLREAHFRQEQEAQASKDSIFVLTAESGEHESHPLGRWGNSQ